MCLVDASGDHRGIHTRLWVLLWLSMLRGSFPFVSPHVVDVSTLRICILLRAFVVVISVSLGSRVSSVVLECQMCIC